MQGRQHSIKQLDQPLTNRKIDDLDLVRQQGALVVGGRGQAVVMLDWIESGLHGQNQLAINLVTRHGRASIGKRYRFFSTISTSANPPPLPWWDRNMQRIFVTLAPAMGISLA